MWGDLKSEKLLPSQAPTLRLPPRRRSHRHHSCRTSYARGVPRARTHQSFCRRLDRGVRALLNHISPGGQRMPDDMYLEPNGPFAPSVLARSTSWYEPLTRLMNATGGDRAQMVHDVVDGFVDDIECGIVYSAAEHLATQMSFLTSGYTERATLHFQIRLQNVTSDLERLREVIAYYPPQGNRSVWKCPLGRENDAASKGKLPISKEDFLATFRAHPSIVQRLCTVYIQDYLCLGYRLPAECEGGHELDWVPRSGAQAGGKRHGTVTTS